MDSRNILRDSFGYDSDPDNYEQSFRGAALYVGVMLATVTVLLTAMKKSGFRAMVAVGRG